MGGLPSPHPLSIFRTMTRFSILDLVRVREGDGPAGALSQCRDQAVLAERLGFHRYWIAEHHGMEGVASAATAVVLAQIGDATHTIRIGAGGIMLPNHAPLVVAEQFGTLHALFGDRIDLGLGRAPGSDQRTAAALRRDMNGADRMPADVLELQGLLAGDPEQGIIAVPGAGSRVPLWILGSSLYGARLAALLGLPYAFASHFAPAALYEALALYRDEFRPSEQLADPYAAAAFNVWAADTTQDAALLASSVEQSFVQLATGRPGKLLPPVPGYRDTLPPNAQALLARALTCSVAGTVEEVREALRGFVADTGVDEVIVSTAIFDPAAQARSLELTAEAVDGLTLARAA